MASKSHQEPSEDVGEEAVIPLPKFPRLWNELGHSDRAVSCSYSPLKYAYRTHRHPNPSYVIFVVYRGTEIRSSSIPIHL